MWKCDSVNNAGLYQNYGTTCLEISIEYYKSNVNPITQNGIIVYGCCSFSSLLPILRLQKKILKFIYFRKKYSNSEDIFDRSKMMNVYEFHIYDLLKFVLRSVNILHSESMLKTMSLIMIFFNWFINIWSRVNWVGYEKSKCQIVWCVGAVITVIHIIQICALG